jgi:hypothetical protein
VTLAAPFEKGGGPKAGGFIFSTRCANHNFLKKISPRAEKIFFPETCLSLRNRLEI